MYLRSVVMETEVNESDILKRFHKKIDGKYTRNDESLFIHCERIRQISIKKQTYNHKCLYIRFRTEIKM